MQALSAASHALGTVLPGPCAYPLVPYSRLLGHILLLGLDFFKIFVVLGEV